MVFRRTGEVWYNLAMKVKVKLFASLRQFGPDEQVMDLPDRTTIDEVVDLLKIPRTIRLLKIVNGEHRPADHALNDGDDLALFPPIAGG
jgi:molybdopterin converting factor small subunit